MSTITGTTIYQGVTLGTVNSSPTYASPLTITSTGAVYAPTTDGVFAPSGLAGTVINQGTITANHHGIKLLGGGYVNNQGGVIQGGIGSAFYVGVYIRNNGTLTNTGTISGGSSDNGVRLSNGGTINNNTGGVIRSNDGVYMNGFGTAAIVTNAGEITGTSASNGYGINISNFVNSGTAVNRVQNTGTVTATKGIDISQGGVVANYGTGNITGTAGFGVRLDAGGTVINSGTISGTTAAIFFGAGANNLLTLNNGYKLNGGVKAIGASTSLTVQLANTGVSLGVTYSSLGLSGFQNVDVTFGSAGNETLLVDNVNTTLGAVISGFTAGGDVIDLTGIGTNGTLGPINSNTVTVTGSLGSVTLKLDGTDSTNLVAVSDNVNGTLVRVACFCRGTRIVTDRGDMPIEDLQIGTRVITLSGEALPVKWIGRRSYDPRFAAENAAILPIRIAAGAFGENLPARDLFVSPEHALYVDGVLVAARLLVNGSSIRQVQGVESLEYFHIELERHQVLFAEGMPAESYVECGNRGMFHNAHQFAALYPDDATPSFYFCAPRVEEGSPELGRIRASLTREPERREAA